MTHTLAMACMKLFLIVLDFILLIPSIKGFHLTKIIPYHPRKISEGASNTQLQCNSDDFFKFCTFQHLGKKCVFETNYSSGIPSKVNYCNFDDDKIQFIGNPSKKECAIKLTNLTLDDSGEWSCKVEQQNPEDENQGNGIFALGKMNLIVKPTKNSGFRVTHVTYVDSPIMEGGAVNLNCSLNDNFHFCIFTLLNDNDMKKCVFDYGGNQIDCHEDFKNRVRYASDSNQANKICAIEITNVNLNDAGNWTCQAEKWLSSTQFQGQGEVVQGYKNIVLNVVPDFKITSSSSQANTQKKVGYDLTLFCSASHPFEWCSIKHINDNKECEFKRWKTIIRPSVLDCDFGRRYTYNNQDFQTCLVTLKNVTRKDGGQWLCELERFHGYGHGKGYGSIVQKQMIVNVGDQFLMIKPFGKPKITTTEGKEITIQCESNQEFERCTFSHNVNGKKCIIGLKNGGTPTNNCHDFFSYGKRSLIYTTITTCEIKLTSVAKEDSGTWTCEMKPIARKIKSLPNKGLNEDVFGYTELIIQSSKDKITENTKDIITSNDKTNSKKLLDTNNEDFDEETVLTDGEVNGIVISILVVIALIIGLTTFAFLRSYYKQNPN